MKTLRDLAARSLEARQVEEACRIAGETLATNPYDIPFLLLYLLDAHEARLTYAAGIDEGLHTSLLSVDVKSFPVTTPWPLAKVAESGHAELVECAGKLFEDLPEGPWHERPQRALVMPVIIPGQDLPSMLLVLAISPRRTFDDAYLNFFNLIASQIGSTLADALAYEHERQRAEALMELDRAKTAFFSNVSHEFRTPLTLMLGPLEEVLSGNLASKERKELEVVHRNGVRLLKLVNTLLDFSRIEAGRVRAVYEPTDLATYTAELASMFRTAIERVGIRLIVECSPLPEPIYVDREMWEKIVLNLLSNAFKFTFEGTIAVSLCPARGCVELKVSDTGTGIPADELPRLFERFHRIRGAKARTLEGTGIGLALVKELINLHGGTIHAESEPGKGTSFIVSIPTGRRHIPADRTGAERTLSSATPVAEAYIEEAMRWIPGESESVKVEPGASTHSPPRLIDQSPSRILLADDNYDMREYVKRILSSRWTVEAVSDGKSVLEAARAHAPDLILSDVMMPGLNGFELLRELRSDPRTRKVPVILLSARAGEESRIEGLEAGADDYLVKPFSARELVARVESNLKLQRLRLEATELEAALRAEAERRAREAEEKQKILETLLAHVPEGITMVAGPPDFPIVANSRMAEELIGRPAATLRDIPVGQHAESYGIFLKDGVTGPRPEQLPLYRATHYGETITDEEWVIKRPDGESITVVVNVVPIRDSRGSIIGALNCWRDITERKRTEEALRESEELLQTMTRSVPSIIWSATADGRITFHNRQWLEYTGLTPAENEQDWATRVLHPDDYERCIKAWQNALATGEDYAIEIRNRRADGVYRWFLTRAVPHRDSTGQIVSWFGSTTDIHDNKLTEEKLRQSEERFRQAADAANALIYEVDLLSGETAVVYGLERVTGYDPGETIATSGWWHSLIHPEDLPGHLSQLKRNLERGGAYLTEYRIRHKDGSWRNVQDNGLRRRDNGHHRSQAGGRGARENTGRRA
jgi:PAS domain S-box-containing protein